MENLATDRNQCGREKRRLLHEKNLGADAAIQCDHRLDRGVGGVAADSGEALVVCRCTSSAEHEARAAMHSAQALRYQQELKDKRIKELEAEIAGLTVNASQFEVLEVETVG